MTVGFLVSGDVLHREMSCSTRFASTQVSLLSTTVSAFVAGSEQREENAALQSKCGSGRSLARKACCLTNSSINFLGLGLPVSSTIVAKVFLKLSTFSFVGLHMMAVGSVVSNVDLIDEKVVLKGFVDSGFLQSSI